MDPAQELVRGEPMIQGNHLEGEVEEGFIPTGLGDNGDIPVSMLHNQIDCPSAIKALKGNSMKAGLS